ncbi:MAG: class A beta-lactamase [Prevotella sp.]
MLTIISFLSPAAFSRTIRRTCLVLSIFLFAATTSARPHDGDISRRIDSILDGRRMTVGIYARCGNFEYRYNADMMFPLMSVFKVHVAMTVLERFRSEGIAVDSLVHVSRESMHEDTYSPLRDRHPKGDFDISVADLIRSSVSESDNNACDLLIDMAGGVENVDRYVRRTLGVRGMRLRWNEDDMHRDVGRSRDNRATPYSMYRVLEKVFEGRSDMFGLLREAMTATVTGRDKIRAGIPEGMSVAHKTGSSDRIAGVKIGDNDAAAVILPSGEICYMVIFIKDSRESDAANAAVMAAVAREIIGAVSLMHTAE